jgi:aryl-alcohol dehydrogenase-like predicted oxidoreductase
MNYRQFGDNGFKVSEIGFGTWGIGGVAKDCKSYGPTDDNKSVQALNKAYDVGVTFYDTSPIYGYGHSEELIGKTFKEIRDRIIINTKVGYINYQGDQDFSPKYIRSSIESSLRRLRTDYVDILQLHDPPIQLLINDDNIIIELKKLKEEGKIRVIGISTSSQEEDIFAVRNFDFKSIQINFNLIDQRALFNGLFDECANYGVGVIGRTPLCFGFLTGKYSSKDKYPTSDHRSMWSLDQIDRWANAVKLFANNRSEQNKGTPTQMALRYCLSYPLISTTIPGMLTKEHVLENTQASQFGALPNRVLKKYNKIFHENTFFVSKR